MTHKVATVYDYLANASSFFETMNHDGPPEADSLKDLPVNTVCGLKCIQIAQKTEELLALCDSHEDVRYNIVCGAMIAMAIVING